MFLGKTLKAQLCFVLITHIHRMRVMWHAAAFTTQVGLRASSSGPGKQWWNQMVRFV